MSDLRRTARRRDRSGQRRARAPDRQRLPRAADLFAPPGFPLFAIRPASLRCIGGFAPAASLTPQLFKRDSQRGAPRASVRIGHDLDRSPA